MGWRRAIGGQLAFAAGANFVTACLQDGQQSFQRVVRWTVVICAGCCCRGGCCEHAGNEVGSGREKFGADLVRLGECEIEDEDCKSHGASLLFNKSRDREPYPRVAIASWHIRVSIP